MSDQSDYVMGHEERERQRLKLQAAVLEPVTEQLFRRAGLSSGMNVLDFGCGVGDVSMLAARLVGHRGRVVGLDMDDATLATARARAKALGLENVTFVKANVAEYRSDRPLDVITGRHIVIHVPDPLGLFRSMLAALRPGGIAVIQEYDMTLVSPGFPATPLRDSCARLFKDFFGPTPRGNMGSQLYHLAVQAGFKVVDCRAEFSIDGGEDSPFFEWFAESVKTVLPRALEAGLPAAAAIKLDGLAERLRQESVAQKASFPAPMMIGCIARKP